MGKGEKWPRCDILVLSVACEFSQIRSRVNFRNASVVEIIFLSYGGSKREIEVVVSSAM